MKKGAMDTRQFALAIVLSLFGFGFLLLLLYGVFGNPGIKGEYIHPNTYVYVYTISTLLAVVLFVLILAIFALVPVTPTLT